MIKQEHCELLEGYAFGVGLLLGTVLLGTLAYFPLQHSNEQLSERLAKLEKAKHIPKKYVNQKGKQNDKRTARSSS